ncbi:MAG: hypothetical protein AAB654_13500 [Acidobacteriota bacterium]
MARQQHQIDAHPKREQIIADLLSGGSNRKVAARYGLNHVAVQRYRSKVLRPAMRRAISGGAVPQRVMESPGAQLAGRLTTEATAVLREDPVLSHVEKKLSRLAGVIEPAARRAASGEGVRDYAAVEREDTNAVELLARLTGRLEQQTHTQQVAVLILPGAGEQPAPAVQVVEADRPPGSEAPPQRA